MSLLSEDGFSTLRWYIVELAPEGGLARDVADPLPDPPSVLLDREVPPAGERLQSHRVGGREAQALEGDSSAPGGVLSGYGRTRTLGEAPPPAGRGRRRRRASLSGT